VGVHRWKSAEDVHEISIPFVDQGVYWLEVVVTFSDAIPLKVYPLDRRTAEPTYEGYLVPGFPRQVTFGKYALPKQEDRLCTYQDISITSPYSQVGRWVLDPLPANVTKEISLGGYHQGTHSLGLNMHYQYSSNCQIPSNLPDVSNHLHLVLVGDSVTRLTYHRFLDRFSLFQNASDPLQVTLLCTSGGMHVTTAKLMEELRNRTQGNQRVLVVFNAGMHEIAQLCSRKWFPERSANDQVRNFTEDHGQYSCIDHYLHLRSFFFQSLKQDLQNSTFSHRIVWQTTTASWPKWGNFGFAWPPDEGHYYPMSPDAVYDLSQHLDLQQHPSVDAYWMTLARPDHRQVDLQQSIGRHLVHPGPQVLDALVNQALILLHDFVKK